MMHPIKEVSAMKTIPRTLVRLALAALLLGLFACEADSNRADGDDDDDDGATDGDSDGDSDADADADGDGDSDTDTECYEQLDIVFVLDVSTTMSGYLSTLESQIGLVWDAALELDDDPHFGLVVFVDDVLVANSGQTYASTAAIQTDFHTWYVHTSSNQQTQSSATNGDWPENTLDALYKAATTYDWRPQDITLRVIIHATDDTFREYPASFSSGIPVLTTYDEVVSTLQQQQIRVASFAAHLGGPMGNADVEPGFFTDYAGQGAIPASTSGQVFDIDQVGSTISLADAINEFVIEEFCDPYEIE
jgi:hypothetical protein